MVVCFCMNHRTNGCSFIGLGIVVLLVGLALVGALISRRVVTQHQFETPTQFHRHRIEQCDNIVQPMGHNYDQELGKDKVVLPGVSGEDEFIVTPKLIPQTLVRPKHTKDPTVTRSVRQAGLHNNATSNRDMIRASTNRKRSNDPTNNSKHIKHIQNMENVDDDMHTQSNARVSSHHKTNRISQERLFPTPDHESYRYNT